MKMDGRRVFVMLRPLDANGGQSGYARMELSGARAQITVAVQGFGGCGPEVYALLLGSAKTTLLGKLVLDARGQGGIQMNLNLNDVDGTPFVSYGILAVGCDLPNRFKILLAGSIGRGGWVDFACAERLAMEKLHPSLCETIAHEGAGRDHAQETQETPEEEPQQDAPLPLAVLDETKTERRTAEAAEDPTYDLPAMEAAPAESTEDALSRIEQASGALAEKEASVPLPAALERAFWPQALWQLHDLFQRFPPDERFDRQGELFARVPVQGEQWDHFLLGVRLDGNWVTGAGYCVPAVYGDPPKGFENAVFMAARDGHGYYCLWEEE